MIVESFLIIFIAKAIIIINVIIDQIFISFKQVTSLINIISIIYRNLVLMCCNFVLVKCYFKKNLFILY